MKEKTTPNESASGEFPCDMNRMREMMEKCCGGGMEAMFEKCGPGTGTATGSEAEQQTDPESAGGQER